MDLYNTRSIPNQDEHKPRISPTSCQRGMSGTHSGKHQRTDDDTLLIHHPPISRPHRLELRMHSLPT